MCLGPNLEIPDRRLKRGPGARDNVAQRGALIEALELTNNVLALGEHPVPGLGVDVAKSLGGADALGRPKLPLTTPSAAGRAAAGEQLLDKRQQRRGRGLGAAGAGIKVALGGGAGGHVGRGAAGVVVQGLPDGEEAVDLGVVEPEDWVKGGRGGRAHLAAAADVVVDGVVDVLDAAPALEPGREGLAVEPVVGRGAKVGVGLQNVQHALRQISALWRGLLPLEEGRQLLLQCLFVGGTGSISRETYSRIDIPELRLWLVTIICGGRQIIYFLPN